MLGNNFDNPKIYNVYEMGPGRCRGEPTSKQEGQKIEPRNGSEAPGSETVVWKMEGNVRLGIIGTQQLLVLEDSKMALVQNKCRQLFLRKVSYYDLGKTRFAIDLK